MLLLWCLIMNYFKFDLQMRIAITHRHVLLKRLLIGARQRGCRSILFLISVITTLYISDWRRRLSDISWADDAYWRTFVGSFFINWFLIYYNIDKYDWDVIYMISFYYISKVVLRKLSWLVCFNIFNWNK